MTRPTRIEAGVDRPAWLLLAFTALLVGLSSVLLSWLLVSYVPRNAALFEGLGMALTLEARIVIAISNWFVRLLPLLVLLFLGGAVAGLSTAVAARRSSGTFVRACTIAGLALVFVEFVASVQIVRSIRGAYATLGVEPPVEPVVQ